MKYTIERIVPVRADTKTLIKLLTDFGRYQDWLPLLSLSRVLAHESDIDVVEFEAPAYSAHRLSFECIRTVPGELIFRQLAQASGLGLSGSLRLHDRIPGSVHIQVVARLLCPWYRFEARRLLSEGLDSCLRALDLAVCGSAPIHQPGNKRLILEVRRIDDGLEVHFMGRKFGMEADAGERNP